MNERIQNLIYELGNQVGIQWTNQDKLKFAELIVRECERVILAESATVEVGGDVDNAWKMGMDCSVHTIKEHFGVEE